MEDGRQDPEDGRYSAKIAKWGDHTYFAETPKALEDQKNRDEEEKLKMTEER